MNENSDNHDKAAQESAQRQPVEHSESSPQVQLGVDANPAETPKTKPKLERKNSAPRKSTTPKVNCPEKIILCIDHSAVMFRNKFKRTVQTVKQLAVFQVLTGAIRQFVMTKSFIDSRHQFALVLLNDTTQLIANFQQSGKDVMFMLEDIASQFSESQPNEETNFDLTLLFDQVDSMVNLPNVKQPGSPPPYAIRLVFVFGRSHSKLHFTGSEKSFDKLTSNPYFFIDCVYIHEEPNDDNCVPDNFTQICELDKSGTSFIYEVCTDRSMSSLYHAFANLLAHPLQRMRDININNHDILQTSD